MVRLELPKADRGGVRQFPARSLAAGLCGHTRNLRLSNSTNWCQIIWVHLLENIVSWQEDKH